MCREQTDKTNYLDPKRQLTNVQDIGIGLGLGIRYMNEIGPIRSR